MNKKLGLLSALLVVQLVLVAIALMIPLGDDDSAPQLLAFTPDQIDRLEIHDGSDEVVIRSEASGWRADGVRADKDKIDEVLEKLASIDAPWPVATSSASAARFEVSEANYQRRVRLYSADEQVAEVFLGTSPGYQRVHARRSGSDEVFSVPLSNYELSADVDSWMDKAVLAMDAPPTRIELRNIAAENTEMLESGDEGWLYNGVAADQDAAATYANRFTTLRVLGLASPVAEGEETPTAIGQLLVANEAEQLTLLISRQGEEDDYFITVPDSDVSYRLATYIAEQLLMTDADFSVQDED